MFKQLTFLALTALFLFACSDNTQKPNPTKHNDNTNTNVSDNSPQNPLPEPDKVDPADLSCSFADEFDPSPIDPSSLTAPYNLVEVGTVASCFYFAIKDKEGKTIKVSDEVCSALSCPGLAYVHDKYLICQLEEKEGVWMYNIETQELTDLFVAPDEVEISGPVVSPDGNRFLFALINQNANELVALTLNEDRKVSRKQSQEVPIHYACGAGCFSVAGEDFDFVDNNTIKYKRHEEMDHERAGEYDELSLNEKWD